MKRSFKLSSYTTAFTEVRYMDIFTGGVAGKSQLSMKGKISGDAMEMLGVL